MKTSMLSLFILICLALQAGAQTIPSAEIQIKTAVLSAPEAMREGATVYGYKSDGTFGVLRKGTNAMICLADDPAQEGFNVSCYHKDLDAFMERGRILKKEGKTQQQIFDIREKEVKSGKLKMPKQPSTLFVLSASKDSYNIETGEVTQTYLRYVVYIPYATSESTGLPLKAEAPGMPWIMDPGTHRAHIMINPPKN